jgi:hypothetical protein
VPRIGDHLHQTRWRVETIQGRAVIRGKEPTLEFLRDDHLRGGTGCNRFVGPWHTRRTRAVMGPLRKSRMSCGPDLDGRSGSSSTRSSARSGSSCRTRAAPCSSTPRSRRRRRVHQLP